MADAPVQMVIPQVAEADEMNEKARAWIRQNRDAWRWMCMAALEHANRGERFGIADLFESVRWRRKAEGLDAFKCNNTLRAPLARIMCAQHPQVAPFIETRKSKCDMGGR